mgnify:CR=1 FL=1
MILTSNGGEVPLYCDYKIEWLDRFYEKSVEIISSEQATVMLGDYNVIPQAEDASDPKSWEGDALYHLEIRNRFRRIINLGFTDAFRAIYPIEKAFTFWDYQKGSWQKNNGIRIDHALLSPQATDRLISCQIDSHLRGEERPSDHVPISIELRPNRYCGNS